MRIILIAIAVLAVTVLPSFANDVQAPGTKGTMKQMMQQHPAMHQAMMRNPQHLLMMAHHRNLVTFGRKLGIVAQQGETVPAEFARTAIGEMRRSAEEMEKYRASSMRDVPTDMRKMMDEHLVNVKTHLRQLEDLAKKDRIQSQEVINHLQFLSDGCADCGMMHGRGMYGRGMQGMHRKGMYGRGMHGCCQPMEMMPERGRMMQDMMQNMKEQDAALTKQVSEMKRAPKDKKVDIMADIVIQMVQQRAAMTAHMEKMMQKRMQHPGGASMAPPCMQNWADDDEDADDMILQEKKMRR